MRTLFAGTAAILLSLFFPLIASAASLESAVARGAQMSATTVEDGVVRIGWQRDDVPVLVDGIRFPPPAGLGSWAAFKSTATDAMVMGDTVVFEDEITPAMDAAFAHGLSVTALHNHFVYDDPPVYFMHIGGRGDPEALARGVGAMWNAIRSVRAEHPTPRRLTGAGELGGGDLDVAALEQILGGKAARSGDVAKFTFARTATMSGLELGGSMGLTTWAAFVGDDQAASVDGDFMMTADEVQGVMRVLRRHQIHIVALHNHMIGEDPHAYFLHFWGRGAAAALARGIREALDAQNR